MRGLGIAGCTLQAFGPAVMFILFKLRHSPQLSLISVAGSFLFVMSLLLCATWWYIVPTMQTSYAWNSFWSVIFQSMIQIGYFYVYLKTEAGFNKQGEVICVSSYGALPIGFATGFGFGVAEVILTFGMLLNNSYNISGPGATIYDLDRCAGLPILYLQSLQGCLFIMLQALWVTSLFAGMTAVTDPLARGGETYTQVDAHFAPGQSAVRLFPRNSTPRTIGYGFVISTVLLHLFASLATTGPCEASLPVLIIIVFLSGGLTVYCAKVSFIPFTPIARPLSEKRKPEASEAAPPSTNATAARGPEIEDAERIETPVHAQDTS
eukprot:PhF_6_TR22350/c0_g1_i2/m.31654/K06172/APH1A; gamma-secretase subunit APH-1A